MLRPPRSTTVPIAAASGLLAVVSIAVVGVTLGSSSADGRIDRTVRIAAEQDAFATSAFPWLHRPSSDRLVARASDGVRKTVYLRFTVAPDAIATDAVVAAKLIVSPGTRVRVPVNLHVVDDTTWTEGRLNYRSAPKIGPVVDRIGAGRGTARWFDVTDEVQAAGVYSFALTTTEGVARFQSSETGQPPVLVLRLKKKSASSTSPTPTAPPTSSASPTPTAPSSSEPAPASSSAAPSPTGPVPSPTQDRQCAPRFPGDPCAGALYYGAAVEGGDPRVLENQIGTRIGVFRSYMLATSSVARFSERATADVASGRIPLISTKVPGSWADVAAGRYDGWLVDRIKALASVPGPVWLALHHEPSGDGNPADWVAMQQHARVLIDRYSSNIALVGILNGWDFLQRGGNPAAFNMPVGTGVDIMGFDSYNPWSPTNGKEWKSVEDTLRPGLVIQSWGYPTLLGEYGVREDPSDPARAVTWLRDAYKYAAANGFVAMSYFDSGANSPDGTWELTGSRLRQFTENLLGPSSARLPTS